jgi:hypothetical protein
MARRDFYREALKQEFTGLINSIDLTEPQRYYLRSRWLDQVLWMEGRANRARDLHYKLRLTTIIGGVIIPALVSLNLAGNNNDENIKRAIFWTTFAFSQAVAISAATEQFFNYGERWRHYRRSVETLKTQGWQFFELSGAYQPYKTYQQAFNYFAGDVESILQRDVEVYSTQVVQAKREDAKKEDGAEEKEATSGGMPIATLPASTPLTDAIPNGATLTEIAAVAEPIDEAVNKDK